MSLKNRLVAVPWAATLYSRLRGLRKDRIERRRVDRADAIIVSFPKSGRTFVRTMLARLFQIEHGVDERRVLKFSDLLKASPSVPRLLFSHDGDAMRRADEIRVDERLYAGRKVALLVRHPADTIISRYHHLRDRSDDPARRLLASQPLESFLWTEQGGIPAIVEYMNQWAALMKKRGDILLVRYEDVLADPAGQLTALGRFVGLEASGSAVADAVEFARLENLRAKERAGYFDSKRFGAGRSGEEASFKVRSGKAGGWRAKLGEDDVTRIERYLAEKLNPVLDY